MKSALILFYCLPATLTAALSLAAPQLSSADDAHKFDQNASYFQNATAEQEQLSEDHFMNTTADEESAKTYRQLFSEQYSLSGRCRYG